MSSYYNPREITLLFAESATSKRNIPLIKFCILSILGGIFIAFGGLLSIMVSGGMTGIGAANPGLVKFVAGALFPVGLIMVSITGADLFTSNCAGFCFPLLQRKINVSVFFKYLLLSYLFNFIGTQFIAFVLSYEVGLLDTQPWQAYLHHYSEIKVNQSFSTIFLKGIGANWLVCLGVFMGYSAKDISGRCISIWIPVMLFVTLGYEHSIANMFFIPAAIYSGADITWGSFLIQNLIPSTLGNLVGGAGLVGCVYGYLYLKEE
ncbi:formate/nitrite transporter [Dysgonomonas alginatilytica]|uniref:Formate/nitrite transporter n=1 Tax=Dysgonomonas alginatilytica TaxID=1605892 RepID=A0A2V3PPP2_9BACT|nr:formate/nitrite transporter family protein [Dysgonomonas alginatilytica]PXV63193.1 formate/nitrite transporter [Dysgonomonas alginatilytica]